MMTLKTSSGKPLHPIGIGTWGIGGTWEPVRGSEETGIRSIQYSLTKGQNHIDSGEIYGGGYTDEIIGQAIKGVKRENIYLADKLWETSVARGKVRPALELMLKKLGSNYLDLLYIHKPWDDYPWREAIPQIDDLIDEGVVRHFGVSNFNVEQMREAAGLSKHPIAATQLYFNALHRQTVSREMSDYCEINNIQIVAYRPLERGDVSKNETLQSIAKSHNATPTQISLAWLICQNIFPIPRASSKVYIEQNLASIDIKLSSKEMSVVESLKGS